MKSLFACSLALMLGIRFCSAQPPVAQNNPANKATGNVSDVLPTEQEMKISTLVPMILGQYHYRKVPLNDSLSSVIFDRYLKALDPNRMYFLQSDVDNFEKYRRELDNALKDGNLVPAYYIFNIYKRRVTERSNLINKLFEKEFDYTTDETYEADREKMPWVKTNAELDEIWRKAIKYQALSLRLANKSWAESVKTLKDRYNRLTKYFIQFDTQDVFQIYMNAYTQTFDPHTDYFNPSTAEDFKQDISQSLEGIGATLTNENDYVKVADIVPGGPAFKSELLHKNDRIAGVAQGDTGKMVDIVGWRTQDAVKLIRGKKGTVVRLTILPAAAGENAMSTEIRIVRDKVRLEEGSAKKSILDIKENGKVYKIGVITIPGFYLDFEGARKGDKDYKSTTRDTRRLLAELQTEKIDGLIIDLRNNGGGSLQEAVDLTGLFIPKGPVVQVRNQDGSLEAYDDKDPGTVYAGPMAVLINRFSASASEIFAGAIQDYHRGVIVGENSYGKGTVQQPIDLNQFLPGTKEPAGQLKMTIAKFYRITGSSTQHRGVKPDVELPSAFSAEEYGESSQPSALPWDQIRPARFSEENLVDEKAVAKLQKTYQQRLKTEGELRNLADEIKDAKTERENNKVSLQETKRRAETAEAEKTKKARESLYGITSDPKAKPKDVYLHEGGEILADFIGIKK
jgi:carboxyl-terminal processing protease